MIAKENDERRVCLHCSNTVADGTDYCSLCKELLSYNKREMKTASEAVELPDTLRSCIDTAASIIKEGL